MAPTTPLKASTYTFAIRGMTCSSCVHAISNHLYHTAKLDGELLEANVNLLTARLVVRGHHIRPEQIVEEIEAIGYEAEYIDRTTRTGRRCTAAAADDIRVHLQCEADRMQQAFLFCLVFAVPCFMLVMVMPYTGSETKRALETTLYNQFTINDLLLWVLSTAVLIRAAPFFYPQAWNALKHGSANMPLLVTIGTITAYTYAIVDTAIALATRCATTTGEATCKTGVASGNPFATNMSNGAVMINGTGLFETSSMLFTFILLGQLLQARANSRTSAAMMRLSEFQSPTATLLIVDNDERVTGEIEVDTHDLQPGDLIKCVRGERFPADGTVTYGSSSVDESAFTGESMPIMKCPGDNVTAGTINQTGVLNVRVTKAGEDTALAAVLRALEEAQSTKLGIQRIVDKIASIFVPSVIFLSVCVFCIWFALDFTGTLPTKIIGTSSSAAESVYFAFRFGLSVMVVACPCALGLATPTAIMCGSGRAAQLGILLKGGRALETRRINALVFDKTGTLTLGKPRVIATRLLTCQKTYKSSYIWWLIGSSEQSSEHSLAQALITHAKEQIENGQTLSQANEFNAVDGAGISCKIAHHTVIIGNYRWMNDNAISVSADSCAIAVDLCKPTAATAIFVAIDGILSAIIAVADAIRPEAAAVVHYLQHKRSIEVWICSGDNEETVRRIAHAVGIPEQFTVAEANPFDKANLIKNLQGRHMTVAHVGDGVNDSVALAQSDMGIAIGRGSQISAEAADVVLLRDDLRLTATALDITHATYMRIRLNFLWAFMYNILMLPLAAGVFAPLSVRLPPEMAAASMAMSSIFVVLSSLLLYTLKETFIPMMQNSNAAATAIENGTIGIAIQSKCCSCTNCCCTLPSQKMEARNSNPIFYAKTNTNTSLISPMIDKFHKKKPDKYFCYSE